MDCQIERDMCAIWKRKPKTTFRRTSKYKRIFLLGKRGGEWTRLRKKEQFALTSYNVGRLHIHVSPRNMFEIETPEKTFLLLCGSFLRNRNKFFLHNVVHCTHSMDVSMCGKCLSKATYKIHSLSQTLSFDIVIVDEYNNKRNTRAHAILSNRKKSVCDSPTLHPRSHLLICLHMYAQYVCVLCFLFNACLMECYKYCGKYYYYMIFFALSLVFVFIKQTKFIFNPSHPSHTRRQCMNAGIKKRQEEEKKPSNKNVHAKYALLLLCADDDRRESKKNEEKMWHGAQTIKSGFQLNSFNPKCE